MSLLRCQRAVALAGALAGCVARLALFRLRGPLTPHRRALWLQACCRSVLAAAGVQYRVHGVPPQVGLVVSNHLSYLDIAAFAAAMPCVFVSKLDVRGWPFFGWAAHTAGTVFLDRASHASAINAAQEMARRLAERVPVLLFPEGTSTDGTHLLRFHSTLFEPAMQAEMPVTPASIRYQSIDGAPEHDVCWYGDAAFLPHLWKILALPGILAEVTFAESRLFSERRVAARHAHDAVEAMRMGLPCAQ